MSKNLIYRKMSDEEVEELLKDDSLQIYISRGIELKWWSSGDYDEIGHYHLTVFKGTLVEKEIGLYYNEYYHLAKKYGEHLLKTDENEMYKLSLK